MVRTFQVSTASTASTAFRNAVDALTAVDSVNAVWHAKELGFLKQSSLVFSKFCTSGDFLEFAGKEPIILPYASFSAVEAVLSPF